jgi:hypothetical protein
MLSGDRNKNLPILEILTAIVALVLCCSIVGMLAYSSGQEAERHNKTPAAYSETAKKKAQEDCVGRKGNAAFECIYEKVASSKQQAHDEQDLMAQQKSANGTMITAGIALFGLFVSGVGMVLLYTTFQATRAGNKISENFGYHQLRPFLIASDFKWDIFQNDQAASFIRMMIKWENAGNTPASDVSFDVLHIVTKHPIWGNVEPIFPDVEPGKNIIGPKLTKFSAPVYIPFEDIADCFDGTSHLYVFARVTYRNNIMTEIASESRILWKFYIAKSVEAVSSGQLEHIAEMRYIEDGFYTKAT